MIFLSIDLDFWRFPEEAVPAIEQVVGFVRQRGLPCTVVMNHQQILPLINASPARTLVNIDEHSDLSGPPINDLNCGTWVSYVRWRAEGRYLWVRNHPNSYHGCCNGGLGRWNYRHEWASARTTHAAQHRALDGRLTSDVIEVVLCLSPAFTPEAVYDVGRKMLKGFPYRREVKNEHQQGRTCRPPPIRRTDGPRAPAPRI